MYLLWILGWVYLRQKSGANWMHQRKKCHKWSHKNHIRKICRFGDPQQHKANRALRWRKFFGTGLKTKSKHNYQPFHLHSRNSFSCFKWAVRINHSSLCEFISCSVLSSFHKSIMDHQFASSVSSLTATLRALFNFKNRLTTESAKKC